MKFLKQIVFIFSLTVVFTAQSQVKVSLKIGTAPNWGPAGYTDVQYYYLPDIEVYYDINTSMFIYLYNGVWIRRTYLPYRYRYYDLYGGYKVVLNHYHGYYPYGHFRNHRYRYGKGYRGRYQRNIGTKPGKVKPHVTTPRPLPKPTPRPKPALRPVTKPTPHSAPRPVPKKNVPVKSKSPVNHIEKKSNGGGNHGNGGGQKGGGNSGGKGGGGHGGKH